MPMMPSASALAATRRHSRVWVYRNMHCSLAASPLQGSTCARVRESQPTSLLTGFDKSLSAPPAVIARTAK
jgi:hypothetical protein